MEPLYTTFSFIELQIFNSNTDAMDRMSSCFANPYSRSKNLCTYNARMRMASMYSQNFWLRILLCENVLCKGVYINEKLPVPLIKSIESIKLIR